MDRKMEKAAWGVYRRRHLGGGGSLERFLKGGTKRNLVSMKMRREGV